MLDGPWTVDDMLARCTIALGSEPKELKSVVVSMWRKFGKQPPVDRFENLREAIHHSLSLRRELVREWPRPPRRIFLPTDGMAPHPAPAWQWNLPVLDTPADVAKWLGLELDELAWLSRPVPNRLFDARPHYSLHLRAKTHGGHRLIEAPKARLKSVQRHILHRLLDRVPPHPSAFGFRIGRSVREHAAKHAGAHMVLRLDLEDFFPSIPAPRIFRLFHQLGYAQSVARVLAGLCTCRTPRESWPALDAAANTSEREARFWAQRRAEAPHLPQGAPTSPALANLCSFALDVRLEALARSANATYSRYADDLTFSGDAEFAGSVRSFTRLTERIVREEGFRVNRAKTRQMSSGTRQRVGGLVVNERPHVARSEFDRLKAVLHNCAVHGPTSQNRERHPNFREQLLGRIGWVESVQQERGKKLRTLFERIDWSR
jgi:retron-type reverse transcriptase